VLLLDGLLIGTGNESKSDIHPVMIEKSRSKAYYANLVWGLAGE
jgi:hypothetical protein